MHGYIRERKEIPNDVKFFDIALLLCQSIQMSLLADNSGKMVIYVFLLLFSSLSCQKKW